MDSRYEILSQGKSAQIGASLDPADRSIGSSRRMTGFMPPGVRTGIDTCRDDSFLAQIDFMTKLGNILT